MKYFVIEITKPSKFVEDYQAVMTNKINNSEFEVVKVCESKEDADKQIALFVRKNIKQQSGLHYEIIQGDGSEGYNGLKREIKRFYGSIS